MLPGGHQAKVTRLSKAIAVILVLVFVADYVFPSTSGYLSLVPGRTLPCVWNLVTAGFVTTDIFTLCINVAALLLLARLVEPVYGSKELVKFLLIVDFTTCVMVFIGVYITYAYSIDGKLLYTKFHGFHGMAAGLLVAVKQIMGDQEIKLLGAISLHIRHIPILVILAATAVAATLQQHQYIPFLYVGAYSAWLYLRFFQQGTDSAVQGDASDAFKLSSFFPSIMTPVIDQVAAVTGAVFRLRHTPPAEGQGMQIKAGGPSMLGSDAVDANRRRERGAKALEERLGMKKHASGEDIEEGVAVVVAKQMEGH